MSCLQLYIKIASCDVGNTGLGRSEKYLRHSAFGNRRRFSNSSFVHVKKHRHLARRLDYPPFPTSRDYLVKIISLYAIGALISHTIVLFSFFLEPPTPFSPLKRDRGLKKEYRYFLVLHFFSYNAISYECYSSFIPVVRFLQLILITHPKSKHALSRDLTIV